MILLDTNVVSELMKPLPEETVSDWIDAMPRDVLFTSAIVEAEILSGIATLPEGRRRTQLAHAARAVFDEDFVGRVLPVDRVVAAHYASITQVRRTAGRPLRGLDGLIAATALAFQAKIATRNVADFSGCGIDVIDPWQPQS